MYKSQRQQPKKGQIKLPKAYICFWLASFLLNPIISGQLSADCLLYLLITYVSDSCNVFHQFLVIFFDALGCLLRHRFCFIHLSFGLEQRVSANLFFLVKYLVA